MAARPLNAEDDQARAGPKALRFRQSLVWSPLFVCRQPYPLWQ
ncbi:hypothetical protein APV28_3435 [Comamonas testosteroni]|nr:hypothetical protein APV28_3435 [Comamonas testosteroni]